MKLRLSLSHTERTYSEMEIVVWKGKLSGVEFSIPSKFKMLSSVVIMWSISLYYFHISRANLISTFLRILSN